MTEHFISISCEQPAQPFMQTVTQRFNAVFWFILFLFIYFFIIDSHSFDIFAARGSGGLQSANVSLLKNGIRFRFISKTRRSWVKTTEK